MKSYRLITLTAQPPTSPRGGSSAYVISVLAHVGGCFGLFFGLSHTPRFDSRTMAPRFTIRILNASAPETPVQQQSTGSGDARFLPQVAASDPSAGGSPTPMAPAAPQLPQLIHQNQTLVQPDAPPSLLTPRMTPVPAVFMWTPDNAPIKPVIEAPIQKSIVAMLRASLDPPNRELNLSDIRMSSTNIASALQPIRPSTTSPIVVRGPEPARQMPETASKPAAELTPARILSLSDLRAQEGPVEIPLANATGRPTETNSLSAGRAVNPAEAGHGSSANNQPGVGSGQASGSPLNRVPNRSVGDAQPNSGPGQNFVVGPDLSGLGPVTRINLPKDGQFGVVVVGSSLADQYPEIADTWSSRLVYTVYLHAGAGKSWILQYSLPQAAQVPMAASNGRPDAPWPYEIVRPRFASDDVDSDPLMVHGFVNSAGRFERLALVFPADFVKAKFLLAALQQWEFRPARQNGMVTPVEILLIIPAEAE